MRRDKRKFPRVALIVSLAVHLSIIVGAIGLPYMIFKKEIPGPGDNVMVWLSEPSGDVAYGPGKAAVTKSSRREQKRKTVKESITEIRSVDHKDLEGDRGKTEDDMEAGGVGAAGGPGVSKGKGGNELLAKIWSKINASKYYPAAARHGGVTGSPKVSFALAEDGRVKWVKLVKSCGKKILDDAALETVRRAAPLPYYPRPITVTVQYSLTR